MQRKFLTFSYRFIPILLLTVFAVAIIIATHDEPLENQADNPKPTPTPDHFLHNLPHGGGVLYGEWSQDDHQVLTASDDGIAHVWSADDGRELFSAEFTRLLFAWDSPTDRLLLITDNNTTVQLWNVEENSLLFSAPHAAEITQLEWLNDPNQFMTVAGDTVSIWDMNQDTPLFTFYHNASVVFAVLNQNQTLVLTFGGDVEVRIWDVATGENQLNLATESPVFSAMWNTAETQVLTAQTNRFTVWNAESGEQILSIEDENTRFFIAMWSLGEKYIFTLDAEFSLGTWDAETGNILYRIGNDDNLPPQWSPDGTRFVMFASNAAVMYDTATGGELFRYQFLERHHPDEVYLSQAPTPLVNWSAAGSRFLVADGTKLSIVDANSGELIRGWNMTTPSQTHRGLPTKPKF